MKGYENTVQGSSCVRSKCSGRAQEIINKEPFRSWPVTAQYRARKTGSWVFERNRD